MKGRDILGLTLVPTNYCAPFLLPPANDVCEGYVFTRVCHSVHGGGFNLQAHTNGGGSWGVWPGGSPGPHPGGSPGPHGGGGGFAPACCIPACTEADTPLPSRRLLLQAVPILLECILVLFYIYVLVKFVTSQTKANTLDVLIYFCYQSPIVVIIFLNCIFQHQYIIFNFSNIFSQPCTCLTDWNMF